MLQSSPIVSIYIPPCFSVIVAAGSERWDFCFLEENQLFSSVLAPGFC